MKTKSKLQLLENKLRKMVREELLTENEDTLRLTILKILTKFGIRVDPVQTHVGKLTDEIILAVRNFK
jgi:hypothetical protein